MNLMIVHCSGTLRTDLLHTHQMLDRWCPSLLSLTNVVSLESSFNLLGFSSPTVAHILPCVLLTRSLSLWAYVALQMILFNYPVLMLNCIFCPHTDEAVKTPSPALSKALFISAAPCVTGLMCASIHASWFPRTRLHHASY